MLKIGVDRRADNRFAYKLKSSICKHECECDMVSSRAKYDIILALGKHELE